MHSQLLDSHILLPLAYVLNYNEQLLEILGSVLQFDITVLNAAILNKTILNCAQIEGVGDGEVGFGSFLEINLSDWDIGKGYLISIHLALSYHALYLI